VPAAAKTIVLAPHPVSSVVMSGLSDRSSHASALHSSPKNAVPPPWASGGDRRISSQTGVAAAAVGAVLMSAHRTARGETPIRSTEMSRPTAVLRSC
jgi:hypothetical protein